MHRQTIQAVRVHQFGGPEKLMLEQIPCPVPQAHEVLVRVHATGVLPVEWKIRQGTFQAFQPVTLPYIPGSAFAGVIEEVGSAVATFKPGQAVFGRSNTGTYAQYTTTAIDTLALKPASLSFDTAATISGGATTAWVALFENGALQPGQRVLIHAAAGGVGAFAVQFARWKGAHVIATTSTANVEFVRSLGAETIIDYTSTPFEHVVHHVDMVLDTLGGTILQHSMQVLKRGGILVSLLEIPSQAQAQEYGIRAMKNTATQPFPSSELLQTIARLIDEGEIMAPIGRIFPLREAAAAHVLSQSGHGRGRIVLHITD